MRAVRLALVLVVVPLAGCAALLDALRSGVATPTATYQTSTLERVTLEDATVKAVFSIHNPNNVEVSLAGLDWSFALDAQKVLDGAIPTGLRLPARGRTELQIPITVPFKAIPAVATTLAHKKEAPYAVDATVKVNTPLGLVRIPVGWQGVLPIPKLPKVSIASAKAENLSISGARLAVKLKVDNPNVFSLPLDTLAGMVTVSGREVARLGLSSPRPLGAGQVTVVDLPFDVSFLNAGVVVTHAMQTGQAQVGLSGEARVAGTKLPLNLSTTLTR